MLPRGAVWQALLLLCVVLFVNEVHTEGRVVCYYTNWSVYRPGTAKFNPQNINPYLCTHLIYAFGGFTKDNQMKPFDKYQDIEQGGYAKFTGLKTYNKQLKTMIAIGGWNEASSRFSPLVANPDRRQQFIKNILKFLRQNHFDGIDLDWEYPAHREGGKPRDRDNYAQFVQELRAEFERESEKTGRTRLLLTMAVPAGIEYIEKGYDIPKLNKYLDWFNVLTYDFHSSHEPSVNHHAPLYSLEEESEYNYDTELNIDYSIKFYLNAGADRDKLVLGIPTYGRSYTLINEESTEIGAPAEGPGEQGDATREKGYLAYYEICQNIKEDPDWTVVQPNPNAMGPFAFKHTQWVGYDDEDIVRKKAEYVVAQRLGGIMFWAIDNDDFRGVCTGKPYPLIEAAKEAMLEGLGLGINEVSRPSAPKKSTRARSRDNSSNDSRNRISGSSKGTEYKELPRRPSQRNRPQNSTTKAPSTTIKLTEAEGSSLYIGGRTTTPAPPTTPDPGTDFKCEEEGFFQHPRDCKKYYWCLDSGPSGLGIVAHMFTCPSGLYFNPAADSCDFARNVPCKVKKTTTAAPTRAPSTTPRPTSSVRITAATSRNSFLRTTPRTTTTTTSTSAPEEDYEDEEVEVNTPTKESEEDPKVIKELIELIRKVGGIEELEKHLLRKADGTISIKNTSSSTTGSTNTPSQISKSIYDKVLSRPGSYNTFRNRLTSTALLRNNVPSATQSSVVNKNDDNERTTSDNYSKYSSVVRSRQGPQNEGLEKLSELDALLKEPKQYVTIQRQRSNTSNSKSQENSADATLDEPVDEEEGEVLVAEEEENINTTRRPITTPAYVSIRRTRPPTTTTESPEDPADYKEIEANEEVPVARQQKITYASLSRIRIKATTEEPNEEVYSTTTKHKYLELTRPTKGTTPASNEEDGDTDDEDDEESDGDSYKTVQLTAVNDVTEHTSTTTRTYANINRRTTTTATPETTTENIDTNTDSAKPTTKTVTISTTTTTINPLNSDFDSTTILPISGTYTELTSTILSIINEPTTSTVAPPIENINEMLDITTNYPNDLEYQNIISTIQTSPTPITTPAGIVENLQFTTKATTLTDLKTTTTTTTTNDSTGNGEAEVTNINKYKFKTPYQFNTRQRTTLNNNTNTNPNDNSGNNFSNNASPSSVNESNNGINSNNSTRVSLNKYSIGGRRQQQLLQQQEQLERSKTQIRYQQKTPTTATTPTVNSTEAIASNQYVGSVSSPRPFGYPRRRTRPTTSTSTSTTTDPAVAEGEVNTNLKRTRLNAQKKYQNIRGRTTKTPTTTTTINNSDTNQASNTYEQESMAEQVNNLMDDDLLTITTEYTSLTDTTAQPPKLSILDYQLTESESTDTEPHTPTTTVTIESNISQIIDIDNDSDSQSIDTIVPVDAEFAQISDIPITPKDPTITTTITKTAPGTPKRIRKIIRKLIRPVNGTSAEVVSVTTENLVKSRSRFGFNRSANLSRTENEQDEKKLEGSELRTINRGRSRFAPPGAQTVERNESNIEPNTTVFKVASRSNLRSRTRTENPTGKIADEIEKEHQTEIGTESGVRDKSNVSENSESRTKLSKSRITSTPATVKTIADVEIGNGIDVNDVEEAIFEETAEKDKLNSSEPNATALKPTIRPSLRASTTPKTIDEDMKVQNIEEKTVNETDSDANDDDELIAETEEEEGEDTSTADDTSEYANALDKKEQTLTGSEQTKSPEFSETEINLKDVITSELPALLTGQIVDNTLEINKVEPAVATSNNLEETKESKPEVENSNVETGTVRSTFRRRLVNRRPYKPTRPTIGSLTSTTTGSSIATATRKYTRRKFGRFESTNTATQTSVNEPNNRTRFTPSKLNRNIVSNQSYDELEAEIEEKNVLRTQALRPVVRPGGLFNREQSNSFTNPVESKLNEQKNEHYVEEVDVVKNGNSNEEIEDGDELDEVDEEEEDEEDLETVDEEGNEKDNETQTPKTTSSFRPKDNRAPPSARGTQSQPTPRYGTYASPATQRYAKPRTTNRPRIINIPQRPIANDFEPTTRLTPTKPAPFIPTNTRSYERKYTATPDPSTDNNNSLDSNALIEDLNIEALNARNKKIFDINSKKHTTLKPKVLLPFGTYTPQTIDTQNTKQNNENENDDTYVRGEGQNFATTTATPPTNIQQYTAEITNNELLSQETFGTTTMPPSTTLLHVFTLTEQEEHTRKPPTTAYGLIRRLVPEKVRPKHKVVEINRIVEINSKEQKLLRQSKANQEFLKPIGTSELMVEALPHIEQLGEISVVKYVHLVDGSAISVDGHSTVADYTPTEASVPRQTASARKALPLDNLREYAQLSVGPEYVHGEESATVVEQNAQQERLGKALVPEVIREAVESSTIALEGLFDTARMGKELKTYESGALFNGLDTETKPSTERRGPNDDTTEMPEMASKTTVPSDTIQGGSTEAITTKTAQLPKYVRPIVPLLRPESNESSPLVISIANLDKVILSKVKKGEGEPNANEKIKSNSVLTETTAMPDSSSDFSSKLGAVVPAPAHIDNHETQDNNSLTNGIGVHNLATAAKVSGGSTVSESVSISTETHVVRKKKSRRHHAGKTYKSLTATAPGKTESNAAVSA